MNHKAIYTLYPTVVTIDDTEGAFDSQGNKVEINMALVNAWVDPDTYKYQRAAEYPSFADQFDTIFHDGIDAWKEQINTIKEKYPKG
jgi:hypothetical protein